MESNKKKRTTNRRQFEEMVERMKGQPDIAKNLTKKSPEFLQEFWKNLAEALNTFGPPEKEVSEWKKVWSDLKSAIRKKLSSNKRSRNATGGGTSEEQPFTELEEEVIQLVCLKDSIDGVPSTEFFGMPKKRKLGTKFTADTSAPVCTEEAAISEDVLVVEALEEYVGLISNQEEENNNNLQNVSSPKPKTPTKTPSNTQLLTEQIGLQKKLYEKVEDIMNENLNVNRDLNAKIDKICQSLEQLAKHEENTNNILQSFLKETVRHHITMESQKEDNSNNMSDIMSE